MHGQNGHDLHRAPERWIERVVDHHSVVDPVPQQAGQGLRLVLEEVGKGFRQAEALAVHTVLVDPLLREDVQEVFVDPLNVVEEAADTRRLHRRGGLGVRLSRHPLCSGVGGRGALGDRREGREVGELSELPPVRQDLDEVPHTGLLALRGLHGLLGHGGGELRHDILQISHDGLLEHFCSFLFFIEKL